MVKMSVGREAGQRENGVPPGRSSMSKDATGDIGFCRVDDSDRSPVRYSKGNMANL